MRYNLEPSGAPDEPTIYPHDWVRYSESDPFVCADCGAEEWDRPDDLDNCLVAEQSAKRVLHEQKD